MNPSRNVLWYRVPPRDVIRTASAASDAYPLETPNAFSCSSDNTRLPGTKRMGVATSKPGARGYGCVWLVCKCSGGASPKVIGSGLLHVRKSADVVRLSVSPEAAGLVGCWRFVAVQRERIPLNLKERPTTEAGITRPA
jgi:hypothetical protein